MEEIFNSHTRTRARTHTIDLHSIRTEKSRISDRELAKQRKNERMTKRAACTKESRVMKYPSVRELNSRETFTMLGDRVCQRTCRPVKPKEFCRSSSVTATSLNLHTKRFIVKDENNLDMSLCFVCATRSLFFFFFFSSHPRRSGNGNFLLQFITLACRVARESIRTHSPHFVSTTITRDFARCGSHNRCHVLVTFETNLKVCADVWRLICAFSLKQIFLFHPFRQIFFQFVVCVRYLSI